MKNLIYFFLNRMFGKKKYYRFFLVLRNIGLQGINYKNITLEKNGELFLIQKIANYFKTSSEQLILFDVGANVGNYSKVLVDSFNNNAHIYSFEPFSKPFENLEQLASKHIQIKPFKIGLSDKNEELIIYSSEECSEIGGVYNRDFIFENLPHTAQEKNQFMTIDSFCHENQIHNIHFLKIDVEGHEFAVLKGSNNMMENGKIGIIQFEFGAGNHFSKTYFIDFFKLLSTNYSIYRLLTNGIIEIPKYNSEFEIQAVTNFVAIHKNHKNGFLNSIQ